MLRLFYVTHIFKPVLKALFNVITTQKGETDGNPEDKSSDYR